MTEVSVQFGDILDGAPIPMLVPTLTKEEIETLSNMQIEGNAQNIPQSIKNKAIRHALDRDEKGLSPFYQDGEEQSGGAGQGSLIEPEGTLLQDEEGNKFRVVGGKYVREQ